MAHIDPTVDRALGKLLDELTVWERTTGRQSLLALIPRDNDEPIVVALNGKQVPGDMANEVRLYINNMLERRAEQRALV